MPECRDALRQPPLKAAAPFHYAEEFSSESRRHEPEGDARDICVIEAADYGCRRPGRASTLRLLRLAAAAIETSSNTATGY